MSHLILPKDYSPILYPMETQRAIKKIKDYFQDELAYNLKLRRVSAPLFVIPESGLNDNLNGVERPVRFDVKDMDAREVEIVQSLAKWKRMALHSYGMGLHEGLYADMNAIRRDEVMDNIHSIYVDQWDWERVIARGERTLETLQETVRRVYRALKKTEKYMAVQYDYIEEILPKEIFFITSQELLERYPNCSPREREYAITKEKGAVFVIGIGDRLSDGTRHDGRAPDYDDWSMNGDILVYYPVLDIALELSSMGVRVDETSLMQQLQKAGCPERAALPFQKGILERRLPYTIGGGIGQSRICMFFLRKAHIGEVQVSVWPEEIRAAASRAGIVLL
jgi:aspartate--ammonia ligase